MYWLFSLGIAVVLLLSALFASWLNIIIPGSLFFVGTLIAGGSVLFTLMAQRDIFNINSLQKYNKNLEARAEIKRLNRLIRLLDLFRFVAITLFFVLDPSLKVDMYFYIKMALGIVSIYLTFTTEARLRQEMIVLDNILMMVDEEDEFGKLVYRGLVQYVSGGRLRNPEEIWFRISREGMYYDYEFVKKEDIRGVRILTSSQVSYTTSNKYSMAAYIAFGNYAFLDPKQNVERHVDTISRLAIDYVDKGNRYTLVLGGPHLNELEYQLRSIL